MKKLSPNRQQNKLFKVSLKMLKNGAYKEEKPLIQGVSYAVAKATKNSYEKEIKRGVVRISTKHYISIDPC
jgi:hypothetical protein